MINRNSCIVMSSIPQHIFNDIEFLKHLVFLKIPHINYKIYFQLRVEEIFHCQEA